MNNSEYRLFKGFFEEEFGLSMKNLSREYLSQKLEYKLKTLKLHSFQEYYEYLLGNPLSINTELNCLPSLLINMESYFLREETHFRVFCELIEKTRKEKKSKSSRTIRVLSAGCSTGQEPYSISMSIKNSGIPLNRWDIQILGMDIDSTAIAKARQGIYNSYSFRGVNGNIISQFTHCINKDSYKLNDDILQSVRFVQGNILNPTSFYKLKDFDFIFCRNVLIYMSKRATSRIALNLWEALSDTGYLFLGQSESFVEEDVLFEHIHFPQAIVYQKKKMKHCGI